MINIQVPRLVNNSLYLVQKSFLIQCTAYTVYAKDICGPI